MNPAPPSSGELLRPNAKRLTRVALELVADLADRLAAVCRIPWDSSDDPDALASEVKAGRALALDVLHDGRRVGSTFVRVLNRRGTRVLHVLGVVGEFPPGSLAEYFGVCEQLGRELGCAWISAETSRPPMVHFLAANGYDAAEVTFHKKLA